MATIETPKQTKANAIRTFFDTFSFKKNHDNTAASIGAVEYIIRALAALV